MYKDVFHFFSIFKHNSYKPEHICYHHAIRLKQLYLATSRKGLNSQIQEWKTQYIVSRTQIGI